MATEDKSVKITLFELIKNKILDNVTEVKTVEIWNNQTAHEDEERSRLYPYVGVAINVNWKKTEVHNGYYQQLKQNQQKGNAEITIHYVYASLKDETNSWLEHEEINHKVFRQLNGLESNVCTKLERISSIPDLDHDSVVDLQTIFQSEIIEYGITENQTTIAAGTAAIQINSDLDIDNNLIRTGDGE